MSIPPIPPEAWALVGVAITAVGGVSGALMTAWVQRGKNKDDASSALVDNLQEEVAELRAEVRKLRDEAAKAHKEMHEAKTEAYAIKDAARLHISMSAAYIYQLRAHIDTEQPPPAPPIPDELIQLVPDFLKPSTS